MKHASPPPRQTVGQLIKLGYAVLVESGAGAAASFSDSAFTEAGADIGSSDQVLKADVVLKVNAPNREEIAALRDGATLVSLMSPALNPDLVEQLASRPITALAMDAVPRISRAQSLDVLSSMANIAGYRAVVEAAHAFGRFFTGQVTAAGKVPPAKVLVVGAGVAGLSAIGAAGSLGAIVRATDPRPEVADQVRSLGGEYVSIESPEAEVSATGYAKEMGDDYKAREAQLYAEQSKDVDIIITTALIPGKPAPRIITADMVASMTSGSVIVDMAAANGGNVEGTVKDRVVVTDNGVTIIGYTDLAGRLPAQASQLYGTNLVNLLKLLTPEKDGQLTLDFDDVVQRSMTVVRDGEVTWPPPPVQVSAAPVARRCGPRRDEACQEADVNRPPAGRDLRRRGGAVRPDRALADRTAGAPDGLRAGHRDRLLRDRQRAPRAAHPADVGDQRDIGDHRGGCPAADRPRRRRRHRAGVRGHPACQHQRLWRLCGDSPHARNVLPELGTDSMFTVETAATAAYVVAALLFILALAGLSKHETSRAGNTFGIAGMAIALVATIALALARHISPLGLGLLIGAMAVGAAIGLWRARVVEMTGMPELIALLHSFVGLAAVLVGWNGYLHVEGDAAGAEAATLAREGILGIHSAEVVIGVFIGAVTFTGSIVANLKLSARIKSTPLMLPGKNILNVGALVVFFALTVWFVIDPQLWLLVGRHRAGTTARMASGRLHRRRRHARGGVDAQQLLRLGRGGVGLPARQRPAHRHRGPGRLLRCLPVLHHVQGDEPVFHLRHRRRLRHRGGPCRRQGLRRPPRDHRRGRGRAARVGQLGDHHSRLRDGRRPSAVRCRRPHPQAARRAASTSGSASTPSRAGCPAT